MHRGIELKITTPAGVVFQCDSDFAHDVNVFAGYPVGQWRVVMRHFEGSPILDEGQADVEGGQLAALLTIELRAVELPDVEAPDDPGQLVDVDGAAAVYGTPDPNSSDPDPDMTTAPPGSGGAGGAVEGGQAATGTGGAGYPPAVRPGRSRWPAGGRWWRDRRRR